MIQVIDRVASILNLVASNRRKLWPMTVIADELRLNRGTCANIMKSLVELGYLAKSDDKKGYTLGFKLYQLTGLTNNLGSMLEFAIPYLEELSERINESVILSTIRNGKRIILYQVHSHHEVQVRAKVDSTVYRTTTGRLQLAYYPPESLKEFIRVAGMPGEEWPEVTSVDDLVRELANIRKKGSLVTFSRNHVVGLAYPVYYEGNVVAAIGVYLPDVRFNEIIGKRLDEALKETAATINALL
ncbi:MAG: helix-turn-helix domain-containing protein [Bacteroidales bacterium]|nr:helix-turn-helix domain-containing protein [Bacteroidales bacterium]